jgi:Gram-negative bacterial TonB protein C-terminal
MRLRTGWFGPALILALVSALAAGGARAEDADPENGKIVDGAYRNSYFGLTLPLPPGYGAGLDPARPSNNGYYVLSTPTQQAGTSGGTILIAAQDDFFAFKPLANAMELASDLQRSADKDSGVEAGAPEQVTIGGHPFVRIKLKGKILSRLVLATDLRCHILSITLASTDPAKLDELAAGFEQLKLPPDSDKSASDKSAPACVKDYASTDAVLHRVEPPIAAQRFVKIPVRIIIGPDGKIRHIHVIRASDADRQSIETALAQWQFKPYQVDGQTVAVETGIDFESK